MPAPPEEAIVVIIAVIIVLLFLGTLFLVSLAHYASKRRKMQKEREALLAEFEKQLLQSRVEMQEQTFNFISQEIHDNVGQVLSFAKVQLSILSEQGIFNSELITQTKESVGKAMAELRDLARSLSSERIRSFDLLQSIEEEVYRINKTGTVRVQLRKDGCVCLKDEQKLLVFRVVQECLQNAVKHASASQICISVDGSSVFLRICLEDDGIGFDPKAVNETGNGLGLKNMQQRMELVGGTLLLESKEGKGTKVDIQINCN